MIKNLLVRNVFAVEDPPFNEAPFVGNLFNGAGSLGDIFTIVTNIIIYVGWGLVLVFLALGFIQFVTAGGDKVATEKAQKWVTYAIIGGVGLLAVFAVKQIVLSLTGASF
jgi:hypothetical protein